MFGENTYTQYSSNGTTLNVTAIFNYIVLVLLEVSKKGQCMHDCTFTMKYIYMAILKTSGCSLYHKCFSCLSMACIYEYMHVCYNEIFPQITRHVLTAIWHVQGFLKCFVCMCVSVCVPTPETIITSLVAGIVLTPCDL